MLGGANEPWHEEATNARSLGPESAAMFEDALDVNEIVVLHHQATGYPDRLPRATEHLVPFHDGECTGVE